jgi:hypothetical protein
MPVLEGLEGAAAESQGALVYRPVLIGGAQVRFLDDDHKVDQVSNVVFTTALLDGPVATDWQQATPPWPGIR